MPFGGIIRRREVEVCQLYLLQVTPVLTTVAAGKAPSLEVLRRGDTAVLALGYHRSSRVAEVEIAGNINH